jgi:poly-gamma-glutamate synthesis protein (capsule biosynthesis protein)
LGNFIAVQLGNSTNIGGIFSVNIRQRFPEKTVEITQVEAITTSPHNSQLNNRLSFRVLPIEAVVNRQKDSLIPASKYRVLKRQLVEMKRHLNSLKEIRAL